MDEVNRMFRKLKQWKYMMEAKLAIVIANCRIAKKAKIVCLSKIFK